MKYPRIKPGQLKRDYRAPHRTDGRRQHQAGGRLTTRPSFTTSVRAQEKALEQRSGYFGDNVSVTHATTPQEPWKAKPVRTVGAVQPPANGGRVAYSKPLNLSDNVTQILGGYTPAIRRWTGLLNDGIPVPFDVAVALRYVGFDIYKPFGDD